MLSPRPPSQALPRAPRGGAAARGTLREFNRAQGGLLIITHDPRLASRCDRTVTMADGVIVSNERRPPS